MNIIVRWLAKLALGTCGLAAGTVLGAGFVLLILPIGPTCRQALDLSGELFTQTVPGWLEGGAARLDSSSGPPADHRSATEAGIASSTPGPDSPPLPSGAGSGIDIDAGTRDLTAVQQALHSRLPAALEATVEVRWEDRRAQALHVGTGVIVSEDGLILSAGHVLGEPGRNFVITLRDGSTRTAQSLGLSLYSDAGILRITDEGSYPHVEIAPGDRPLAADDWCFALGHPGGLDEERGTVVRLGRILDTDAFTIQSSCRLVGGDSGGPLFSLDGRLIGIHSRISPDSDGNFHVVAAAFRRRWDALLASRTLGEPGGWLGVSFDRTTDFGDAPLTVIEVVTGSAAHDAGIRPGDRFTHVSGEPVRSFSEFKGFIAEMSPLETISLSLERQGEPLVIDVILGEEPES